MMGWAALRALSLVWRAVDRLAPLDQVGGHIVGQVEVEFVGGPADGHRRMLPTDADGNPPLCKAFIVPARGWSWLDDQPHEPAEMHRYDREPSTSDDGPLWRYRHRGLFT